MDYCWFILGNGRSRFLERTILSWNANLIDTPKHKIIFDDSGDSNYVQWLTDKFGEEFQVVPVSETCVGQNLAIDFIFKYLENLDVDYFLEVEEDWMLMRPLSVSKVLSTTKNKQSLCQVRLPRTVWHESPSSYLDIDNGTLLNYYVSRYPYTQTKNLYEIESDSYFWSHNPNLFNRKIFSTQYPKNGISSEYDFGIKLIEDGYKTFGYWATNPFDSYVTHIGYHERYLGSSIPELFN
jgi:hypothetical protein